MPAAPLFDFSAIDPNEILFDIEAIRAFNPHRFELEQIDGIAHFDEEPLQALAVRDIREGEFWTRGHFPENPVFPGVLMVEAAAQAASFCFHKKFGKLDDLIFGFGGLEGVRFRGNVRPGDRLLLLVRAHALRKRRAVFEMQGYVGTKMVCEGRVIGVTMPSAAPKSETAEA